LKRNGLLIGGVAWLIGGLLLATFYPDLAEVLWLGADFIQLAFIVSGGLIFIFSCLAIRRDRGKAAVTAALMLGGMIIYFTVGQTVGEHIRFGLVRSRYETRVAEILSGAPKTLQAGLRDCQIDGGPPVRIAFPWQRGVTDNWVGLVYDPSGVVMKANQFRRDWSNWNDQELASVKRLFGGDLYRTKKLAKNWYLCWFT
jgi:hypothetical protein